MGTETDDGTQNEDGEKEKDAADNGSGSFFSHFLFLCIGVFIAFAVMRRIKIRRRQRVLGKVQSMKHQHLDELYMDGEFI